LLVRSERLKVQGIADAVEWSACGPRPVETKRGPVVERLADRVQLCAQALCLEEMLRISIEVGLLFYAESHRRVEVILTEDLRALTESACSRVHELIAGEVLPRPEFGPKCRKCSLEPVCQPRIMARSAQPYLSAMFSVK
jgi:CRISPR-associated exonuclease Cas4